MRGKRSTLQVTENKEFAEMRALIAELQQKENDYKEKIEQLERVLRQTNSLPEVPNLVRRLLDNDLSSSKESL